MRRAKELALEEAAATDGNGVLLADELGYDDVERGVRSGEGDSAALMDDDDISLWDAAGAVHYRDEDSDTSSRAVHRRNNEQDRLVRR
ncbi:hypothetical protein NUW58_g6846 [Xylaria curta]|uniref:Uncharacterized protein n=1 Tax=Xylaria curta TaxID=42375 RepID=A0ACC1NNF1_9PEZI|nr:hypothetical protein NUW58_g6846 [Xylaria curta]